MSPLQLLLHESISVIIARVHCNGLGHLPHIHSFHVQDLLKQIDALIYDCFITSFNDKGSICNKYVLESFLPGLENKP